MSVRDLVKVKVLRGTIDDGKKTHAPGCELMMSKSEAEALSQGHHPVVCIVNTPSAESQSNVTKITAKPQASTEEENEGDEQAPVAPEDPATRLIAIKAAIDTLDKADERLWLKDSVTPEVKAIEQVLGWQITASERNESIK